MIGLTSGDETPNVVGGAAARSTRRRRLDARTARAWARIAGTTAAAAGIALVAVAAESAHSGQVLAAPAGSHEKGTVWVDNVPDTLDPGNDPHLDCTDIQLLGDAMSGPTGTFVISGHPGTGTGEQVYPAAGTTASWSYDQAAGGVQQIAVVSGGTLVADAIAAGDVANAQQGYHFKLDLTDGDDAAKSKVFWVRCDSTSSSSSTSSDSSSQSSSVSESSTSSTGSVGGTSTSSSSSETTSSSSPPDTTTSSSSSSTPTTTSSTSSSTTVAVIGAIHATSTSATQSSKSSQGDPHTGGVNGLVDGASPASGGVDGLIVPNTGAGESSLMLLLGAGLVVAGVSALGCGIRVRRGPVSPASARG